jgi:hypothetical protein
MKTSMIDGVVGASPAESKKIMERMRIRFEDTYFPQFSPFEKEKTEKELLVIEDVNKATNELRKKRGLEPFDIPPDNIHILKKDKSLPNLIGGFTNPMEGFILIQGADTALQLGKHVFHEMEHAKVHNIVQVLPESGEIYPFRQGLEVYPRRQIDRILFPKPETCYFRELSESVVEEYARRYVMSQLDNPLYTDDFAQTKLLREEVLKRSQYSLLLNPEIFQFYLLDNDIICEEFSYRKHRESLYRIRLALSQKYPEKFEDSEDVLDLFGDAMFTGKTLELSRLMEKIFGKGTMRAIGTP